jgi:dihydrofolate synthase / folylpolyglutamate synthase
MNYSQLVQKLFSVNLFGGVKLGLDNCLKLNALLNYPDQSFKTIHVAGTNGKGSVTKKISMALQHAGYKVGLYTSPHISCFRERICINGVMIPERAIENLLPHIFQLAEDNKIPATFFELTTMLALAYFAQEKVDFVVLETGLGGRLDATNIVDPVLSIITSISLEHTEILGNTLEDIALEKAGIIKQNRPVVLGPRLPHKVFQEIALARNSPCIIVNGKFDTFDDENNTIAKMALQAIKISEKNIAYGLSTQMPCRFEIFTTKQLSKFQNSPFPECVILDVAHNPDGLSRLFEAIDIKFGKRPLRVICGLSKSKDIRSCLKILSQHAQHFHLVEAPNGRGAHPEMLSEILEGLQIPKNAICISGNISETVHQAIAASAKAQEILVICGTFFIMGEVRNALGIHEPCDSIDINEKWKSA